VGRVFVSHADDRVAGQLHRMLVDAGHQVFLDVDRRDGIRVGEDWEERLYTELRGADAVVCVISSAYVESQWCAIEVAVAKALGTRLVPLSVQPGVRHFLLGGLQHLDHAADPAGALAAVDEALRGLAVDGGWPDGCNPFPGLRAFDADWRRVFFGRERDIAALTALLRSPAEHTSGEVITVVGPSGCGKSSLVRAGLLPAMAREPGWLALAPVVPGEDPVGALARELATEAVRLGRSWTVDEVRARLAGAGGLAEVADELLVAASGRPRRRRLLLVVDQFEEMLTRASPDRRREFARLIARAAAGPAAVVTTLRPEFLESLLTDPNVADLNVRPVAVRALDQAALAAVVVGPARVAGIDVDDTLVARMVADTGTGEALPLLAFALEQLAVDVGRGGWLSQQRYDQIGGVAGALSSHADAALVDARRRSGRGAGDVVAGLLRLVTVDETGRPTRRRVAYAELPDPVRAELAAFVGWRLLTTGEVGGVASVGVAHEAFLAAWPPLADAVAKAGVALRARREVEHAAAEWAATGRPRRRLWRSDQLAVAVENVGARLRRAGQPGDRGWRRRRGRFSGRFLTTKRIDLGEIGREFLRASMRRDRWLRRRLVTVLSGLLAVAVVAAGVAVVAAGVAVVKQRAAADQQRLAISRQLVMQAEATVDRDSQTALRLSLAAHHIHPDAESRLGVFNILANTPYAGTLPGHTGSVRSVALTSDGRTLASGGDDGTVILWDLSDRTHPQRLGQPLTGHTALVQSVAFTPDGRTLATGGSDDRTVRLWDLSDRTHPQRLGEPLTSPTGRVLSVALSPDGRTLASGGEAGTVMLWDLSDRDRPQRPGRLPTGQTGRVWSVAFTADGHTLASSGEDGTILWDLSDRARPQRPLTGHPGPVRSVALSPDGRTLASVSNDATVILWDTGTFLDVRDQAVELACAYADGGFDPDGWARYVPGVPYEDSCR
jgi:Novel STAND NTPase 1/TIR domain/WD domain, G-beta repeat